MRILVVDDEPGVLLALGDQLRAEGYDIDTAADGERAYEKIVQLEPDLVILDVMLPRLTGFQLCKRLRREGNDVPILFLTAKNEETDVVLGLGFGADDYVTKPFSMREVLARVEALLRRIVPDEGGASSTTQPDVTLTFGDVQLDLGRYEARRAGEPLELTPREYHAMRFFSERVGEVVTRDEILDGVWGKDVFVSHRSVDNLIYEIRQKIERDPHEPEYILSIRSVGYKFVPEGRGD